VANQHGRLLTAIRVDKLERDSIVDAIGTGGIPNDTMRTNGAEATTSSCRSVPPRNELQDTDGAQVKDHAGMYFGHEDKPALADALPRSRGTVNINTASAPCSLLGLSDAEINQYRQERANNPYPTVPGSSAAPDDRQAHVRIDAKGSWAASPRRASSRSVSLPGGRPADGHRGVWRPMPLRSPTEGIRQIMNMGVRAGIYLGRRQLGCGGAGAGQLTWAGGSSRRSSQRPGGCRQLRLKRLRLGLARRSSR
jgi:hypothetical protein